MSRCLVFPPPGYAWNGVGGEDLIQLILKLKREGRRAKKEMKKERRRQKKEMEKAEGNGENYCSLMEEPMISNSRCDYSGDHHSIKRKMPISPSNGCQSSGEYFPHHNRRRCLLQKHKDSEVLFSKPLFCIPTRMDFVVQENLGVVLRHIDEPCHSISERTEIIINHDYSENSSTSILSEESDSPQIESQLRELILDWIPSPMQSVRTEFDDQDWLFDTRLSGRQVANSSSGCTADSCPKNSTQFSYVHSVGEPKTFALPYAIPF